MHNKISQRSANQSHRVQGFFFFDSPYHLRYATMKRDDLHVTQLSRFRLMRSNKKFVSPTMDAWKRRARAESFPFFNVLMSARLLHNTFLKSEMENWLLFTSFSFFPARYNVAELVVCWSIFEVYLQSEMKNIINISFLINKLQHFTSPRISTQSSITMNGRNQQSELLEWDLDDAPANFSFLFIVLCEIDINAQLCNMLSFKWRTRENKFNIIPVFICAAQLVGNWNSIAGKFEAFVEGDFDSDWSFSTRSASSRCPHPVPINQSILSLPMRISEPCVSLAGPSNATHLFIFLTLHFNDGTLYGNFMYIKIR